MSKLTNNDFIEFLKSYNNFLMPISQITKSSNGNSLIESDLKTYSLNDMIFSIEQDNYLFPKTTDTLFFKEDNGNLILYLMEFKFMNLDNSKIQAHKLLNKFKNEYKNNKNFNDELYNNFMDIIEYEFEFEDIKDSEFIARRLFDEFKFEYEKNQTFNEEKYFKYFEKIFYTYEDGNLVNIIFKIIETLNIVIPELYEKYCIENNLQIKDIREYLRNIDKRFILFFVSTYSNNPTKLRIQSKNQYLNIQLEKLVKGKIIDDYKIYPNFKFEYFLKYENLI